MKNMKMEGINISMDTESLLLEAGEGANAES